MEKVSAKNAPTIAADNVAEIKDYLNTELFDDIKVVNTDDLNHEYSSEIDDDLEKNIFKYIWGYFRTLID